MRCERNQILLGEKHVCGVFTKILTRLQKPNITENQEYMKLPTLIDDVELLCNVYYFIRPSFIFR